MWAPILALLVAAMQQSDLQSEGLKALESNQYDQAVEVFKKAVEADPKDYSAHFHLGLAHSLAGRDQEAISSYRKVLELKPGLYQAELNLGILLLRQKQAAEAVPLLASAAGQKPKEYRPVFYLAEAYMGAGDAQKAEERYRQAVEIDAKSAASELGLGRALARQTKLDEAAAHFKKAAELSSEYRDSLLELASLYEQNKRAAEAIAIYEQFPENPAARERTGELLLESGQPAEAIPHLEYAAGKSATAANRYALAMAYLKTKQPDKAIAQLQQAVSVEPGDFSLRMALGRALRDTRNFPAAGEQFLRAVQLQAESKEAWNELAGVLIMAENFPGALAALDRLKALGAETAGHHYFRAIILDRTKQYKPALESYNKFLEMSHNQYPDEEFKARQRIKVIQKELSRR